MKIQRVQYDGDGEWLDVHFDDGSSYRVQARWLRVRLDHDAAHFSDDEFFSKNTVEELNP